MYRDDATVLDILNAARLAIRFTDGIDKPRFLDDEKTQSAVIHQSLILGDAAKRLSADFRTAHPQRPWRMMAGMRDKLVHEYDDVDLDEVWQTLAVDVPRVITALQDIEPRRNDARSRMSGGYGLPAVAQRLDHGQHLFERDEAAAVAELVLIDGPGEFGGVRRQPVVRVAELAALANRHLFHCFRIAAIDERARRRGDHCVENFSHTGFLQKRRTSARWIRC